MSIGPVTQRPPEINVTDAVSLAYERVQHLLFKPFDLGKWFTIGFCAWLAALGETGGFSGSYNSNSHSSGAPAEQFKQFFHQACEFVLLNFYWLLPVAIFLLLFGLVLWVGLLWLNSRGKFMFLHCVALGRAEVQIPWTQYASVANSLFRFQLVLDMVASILFLPLIIFLGLDIFSLVRAGNFQVPGILIVVGLIFLLFLFGLAYGLTRKLLSDFVVPIMYLRGGNCLAAWREFFALLGSNLGNFVLYLLFQIVLHIAIGIITLMIILLTCCVAGCLLLLPYLGTVLLLPVLIFQRAYSLYYLAQFGYDVFPQPPPPNPSASAAAI